MRAQWRKKSRFKLSSLQMLFWNQIAFRKSKHEHCQRLKWQRENPVTSWERKHIGKMCFLVYQTLHSWVVTIPFFQISLKKHVLYQKYYPGHLKKWHLIDKTCDCCWLLFLKIGFSYVYACIWGVELRHIHKISPSSLLNPCLTSVSNGPNFIFKYKDFVIPSEAETIGFRGNSQHYSNIKSTELLRKNTKTSLSDARMPSTGRCPFFLQQWIFNYSQNVGMNYELRPPLNLLCSKQSDTRTVLWSQQHSLSASPLMQCACRQVYTNG